MSRAKTLLVLFILFLCSLTVAAHADSSKLQPMVHTPLTRVEIVRALREGHVKVFGQLPSKNRLAMAWGQIAFENGHGKWSYNHNLGNVGTSGPDQEAYYNTGDHHIYRSFETFADGAAAYWRVIKHCTKALVQFDAGQPAEAAKQLKRCGYFEADLDAYTKAFTSLYHYAYRTVIEDEERERRSREEAARDAEAARCSEDDTTCH